MSSSKLLRVFPVDVSHELLVYFSLEDLMSFRIVSHITHRWVKTAVRNLTKVDLTRGTTNKDNAKMASQVAFLNHSLDSGFLMQLQDVNIHLSEYLPLNRELLSKILTNCKNISILRGFPTVSFLQDSAPMQLPTVLVAHVMFDTPQTQHLVLQQLPNLEKLVVTPNKNYERLSLQFCQDLSNLSTLRHLELKRIGHMHDFCVFSRSLQSLQHLHLLDISSLELPDNEMWYFLDHFPQNLRHLAFRLPDSGDVTSDEAIVSLLERFSDIELLRITDFWWDRQKLKTEYVSSLVIRHTVDELLIRCLSRAKFPQLKSLQIAMCLMDLNPGHTQPSENIADLAPLMRTVEGLELGGTIDHLQDLLFGSKLSNAHICPNLRRVVFYHANYDEDEDIDVSVRTEVDWISTLDQLKSVTMRVGDPLIACFKGERGSNVFLDKLGYLELTANDDDDSDNVGNPFESLNSVYFPNLRELKLCRFPIERKFLKCLNSLLSRCPVLKVLSFGEKFSRLKMFDYFLILTYVRLPESVRVMPNVTPAVLREVKSFKERCDEVFHRNIGQI
eukprot:345999_1